MGWNMPGFPYSIGILLTDANAACALLGWATRHDPVVANQLREFLMQDNPTLAIRIEELDLSVIAYNALKRNGVDYVADLVRRTPEDLFGYRGLQIKTINHIRQRLWDAF